MNDLDIILNDENTCNLGGEITNNCEGCIYNCDYMAADGICVERPLELDNA